MKVSAWCNIRVKGMDIKGFQVDNVPELKSPILIAGFDGWGNAMDVSTEAVLFFINECKAREFARLDPDQFYRYDASRPVVNIETGVVKHFIPPGGTLYAVATPPRSNDLLLFRAAEPSLNWNCFVAGMMSLCKSMRVCTIITLGSMYDSVLPSDRIISGIASQAEHFEELKTRGMVPISYQGPSAIHSMIHVEAEKAGISSISLWCHCPYYLQGATHFGILSHMVRLLSAISLVKIDTSEIDDRWEQMDGQIHQLIEDNPELQEMISNIRKEKIRGSWSSLEKAGADHRNVIDIRDFLDK
jgi:proteasome assembly chaperone (PAC2) family protein